MSQADSVSLVRFACPHCEKSLKAKRPRSEITVECPRCHLAFIFDGVGTKTKPLTLPTGTATAPRLIASSPVAVRKKPFSPVSAPAKASNGRRESGAEARAAEPRTSAATRPANAARATRLFVWPASAAAAVTVIVGVALFANYRSGVLEQRAYEMRIEKQLAEERLADHERGLAQARERQRRQDEEQKARKREEAEKEAKAADDQRRRTEAKAREDREHALAAEKARLAAEKAQQERAAAVQRHEECWQSAQAQGSEESYQQYLTQYPVGKYVAQARQELDRLTWAQAQRLNTVASYQHYLDMVPTGRFRQAAQTSLLERQRAELGALAVAWRGQGVATAASYTPGQKSQRLVVLDQAGQLHPWHHQLPAAWRAASVSQASLVVLVPEQKEQVVSVHQYRDQFGQAAPSITRYRYDLNVRIARARDGSTLDTQHFTSEPRPASPNEPYDLTRIGNPVGAWEVESFLKRYVEP